MIYPEITEAEEAAFKKFGEDNSALIEKVDTLEGELLSLQSRLQEINDAQADAKAAADLAIKTAADAQAAYVKEQAQKAAQAALKATADKAAKQKAERDKAAKDAADAKAKAQQEEARLKKELEAATSGDSKLTAGEQAAKRKEYIRAKVDARIKSLQTDFADALALETE